MTATLVERTLCPACGSASCVSIFRKRYLDLQQWIEAAYQRRGTPRPHVLADDDFELRQCSQCSMIFQAGVPDDQLASEIYGTWIHGPKVYAEKFRTLPLRHFDHAIAQVRLVISALAKTPRDIRFLDFGMGWGDFSMAAKAFGADVTGIELSGEKRAHGARLGIRVLEAPEGTYDAIFMNQVLEHLPDPVGVLEQMKGHLSEGGVILAATPNGAPVYARASGFTDKDFLACQKIVAPLEHLNVFNNATLAQAGRSAGLVASPPAGLSWSRMSFAALKGRVFKKLGLDRETASLVFLRHA